MKKILLVVLSFGFSFILSAQIILPIEVLGPEGTTKQLAFNFTVNATQKPVGVWVLGNNLSLTSPTA